MKCPVCAEAFTKRTIDDQQILHCQKCGGTLFEQNSINRINQKTARVLSAEKQTQYPLPPELICPHDESVFVRMEGAEAVPSHIQLFHCPSCYRVFAPPSDLIAFKKAQRAKIQFFKLWQKPMPSPQAVLAFGIAGLIGVGIIFQLISGTLNSNPALSARNIVSSVYVQSEGTMTFVSFITEKSLKSRIDLRERNTGAVRTIDISTEPTRVHVASVDNVPNPADYEYRIILIIDNTEYPLDFTPLISE